MDLFITQTVFNHELEGKAVHIKGYDNEGEEVDKIFLVKSTNFDHILLTSPQGSEWTFWRSDFEADQEFPDFKLTLTVLEQK